MRTLDLTPLFRSTVGLDRMARLLDASLAMEEGPPSYPPYNIEKVGEERYRITMALAGFRSQDLAITTQEGLLTVAGAARPDAEGVVYLHRGIAGRAFERRFQLVDSIKVVGASLEDGFLHIDLIREIPEALRPRHIPIQTRDRTPPPSLLDHKNPES